MFLVRRILSSALALAIAPTALLAQQPGRVVAPPPPLPAQNARPFAPPPPASASAARPAANNADLVKIQFPNQEVKDVLGYYELLTGKHILADPNVNGPINIMVNDQVPRSEAIKIIETQLNLNGFSLVPAGDDIVKVLGVGKNVRSAGVPLYSDLSMVPDSEQTVSFLLRLHYLDAAELTTQLGQYILPGNNNGFTPLQKSGAVIITETASSVRRLVNLITQLDAPAAPVVEKFVRLERADASKTVEFLNSVFETKSSGGTGSQPGISAPGVTGGSNRRTIRRINEEGQPVIEPVNQQIPGLPGLVALNGDSIIQGRITLTPDIRTNRIHVVTSPVNMPLVEKLIADYDANTPFASPVRRNLRFVNARDVLPILIQALTEPGADNNGANSAATTPSSPNRSQQNSSSGNSNSSNLFNSNSNSGSGSGSGSDSSVGSEELNTQSVDTTPTEATVGTTKIIADPRSNTIILLGSAEAQDKVTKVLDQLDIRAPQVVIRVVIGELTLSNDKEFGANYLLSRSRGALSSNYTGTGAFPGVTPSGTPTTVTNADGTTTTTASTSGATTATSTLANLTSLAAGLPTGFTGGIAGIISVTKGFDIILSALEATNRFKTVNRPVLFTSNNKKAVIISGQEIAVPTNSLSTATTTVGSAALQTNVEFKTVALQLEVVPLINSDREVTLDIVQKLDSVVAGGGTSVGGTVVPTIAKRELKSTVSMPNGATVVLGGLITLSDQKTDGNIPVLSKIPLIGPLFQTRTRNLARSELIILIHPEVTNTPTELVEQRREEDAHMYLQSNLEEQIVPLARKAKPVTPAPATVRTKTTVTTSYTK